MKPVQLKFLRASVLRLLALTSFKAIAESMGTVFFGSFPIPIDPNCTNICVHLFQLPREQEIHRAMMQEIEVNRGLLDELGVSSSKVVDSVEGNVPPWVWFFWICFC